MSLLRVSPSGRVAGSPFESAVCDNDSPPAEVDRSACVCWVAIHCVIAPAIASAKSVAPTGVGAESSSALAKTWASTSSERPASSANFITASRSAGAPTTCRSNSGKTVVAMGSGSTARWAATAAAGTPALARGAAPSESDVTGNPLPPVWAACACTDAARVRLNAIPASPLEADLAPETSDFPRFPSNLAMSDPIWESTVQSLVTLLTDGI